MKSTKIVSEGSAPLQGLLKSKSAGNSSRHSVGTGGPGALKVDKIKEYMEQKFYEQFKPKRDVKSRIRRLALDKDTIRRAQGNSKKQLRVKGEGLKLSGGGATSKKKASRSTKKQSRKARSNQKSTKEICAMVSKCV